MNENKKRFGFKNVLIIFLPFFAFGIKTFLEYNLGDFKGKGQEEVMNILLTRIFISAGLSLLILIYFIIMYFRRKNR